MFERVLGALREHWPEYLIEGFALGVFMISAGVVTTLLEAPTSGLHLTLPNATLRRFLTGVAMGVTAVALIYSPWGRRSGAHMNPAVTLTFLRLGKMGGIDAAFYIVAQFVGGTLGVLAVATVFGAAFASPPVSYVATVPGHWGVAAAFAAEVLISAALMFVVLRTSGAPRLAPYTGLAAGVLVATWIAIEAPVSGMSMNPARSFASAAPGRVWEHLWLYLTAPVAGMLLAAELDRWLSPRSPSGCAKMCHTDTERCIHCGFDPLHNRPCTARGTAR